jgi:hypothetical protein
MSDPFLDHPAVEVLERYVAGELSEAEAAPAEEHLLVCERCRQTVAELDVFEWLLTGAAHGVSAAFVHVTADGPITLEIRALQGSNWSARFWGDRLEGQAVFESPREAYVHLRRSFVEMFPEHLCTAACGGTASGQTPSPG